MVTMGAAGHHGRGRGGLHRRAQLRQGRGFGHGPGARWFMGARERLGRLRDELSLTDEQQAQIKTAREKYRPEVMAVAKRLREKNRVLRALTRADTVDEVAIRAAARDVGDTIADGALLRARIRKEIRPILTQEQREKLDKCRADIQKATDQAIEEAEQE